MQAMNDLCGMDLVPEPKIIIAALKACRRNDDFALAVRFLEAVKEKCGNKQKEIYPYILQVLREFSCWWQRSMIVGEKMSVVVVTG